MSKVVAPLGSFSASGKLGKALVYFSHLGRNVVRSLVTPANPQTAPQGNNRLLLGALGRASKPVSPMSAWYADVTETVSTGQTWVSDFVRNAIAIFGTGNTGVSAIVTALNAHAETAVFESVAVSLGLTSVTIPYADSPNALTPGAQLYALAAHTMALAGANPSLFDRTPYDTPLGDWDSSDIAAFAADIQS